MHLVLNFNSKKLVVGINFWYSLFHVYHLLFLISFRDAEDAVRGRDGYDYDGYRLRVEFPRGAGPRGPGGRPYDSGRGYPPPRTSGSGGGNSSGGRRTNYRVIVSGLPASGVFLMRRASSL